MLLSLIDFYRKAKIVNQIEKIFFESFNVIALAGSVDEVHNLVVQHEHDGGTSATQNIGERALEESFRTLILEDFLETVFHARVDLLRFRFRRLDLQTTLHGVERVRDNAGDAHGKLSNAELGENSNWRRFFLVRVESLNNVLDTELSTTVHDNTACRRANAVVQREKAICFDSFLHAVQHTVVFLHLSEVGTEHGTDVDERVHEGVRDTTGSGTTGNLSHRKLRKMRLLVVFWEKFLDVVLECQVKSSGGDVTDAICDISTPQGTGTEFGKVALEAVRHAGVRLHFARQNARI